MQNQKAKPVKRARKATTRTNDPEKTKAEILQVASRYFAEKGLSGARVDEIAEQTNTSKRMIYYYFESKEGLYLAVLERAYLGIRRIEYEVDVTATTPTEALRALVGYTFDYQFENPDFVRLVAIENIHHAEYIRRIPGIREHNAPVIAQLADLLARGVECGEFRRGLEAVDLHWMISAFAVFNVANEGTFSYLFGSDGRSSEGHAARREVVVEAILRWCRP
jgi:AcrR family transcriptional regulator